MKAKQPKKHIQEQSIEAKPMSILGGLKSIVDGTSKSLWKDVLVASQEEVSEQLIIPTIYGETLKKGEEVNLKKKKAAEEAAEKQEKKPQITSEFMDYKREVINAERVGDRKIEQQITSEMEQIRMELQKLAKTSKIVERTVKDAMADKAPVNPGKYHLNFFRFVLSVLREATQKLEDTASFGKVFTSKKQQSKYWSSFEKQGTTFGLSGERTVATQTG